MLNLKKDCTLCMSHHDVHFKLNNVNCVCYKINCNDVQDAKGHTYLKQLLCDLTDVTVKRVGKYVCYLTRQQYSQRTVSITTAYKVYVLYRTN